MHLEGCPIIPNVGFYSCKAEKQKVHLVLFLCRPVHREADEWRLRTSGQSNTLLVHPPLIILSARTP